MGGAQPLTLALLPLADDGVQPLLLLLRRLGHADKPLVLGRVVDLPAVGDSVAVAVVIRWQRRGKGGSTDLATQL